MQPLSFIFYGLYDGPGPFLLGNVEVASVELIQGDDVIGLACLAEVDEHPVDAGDGVDGCVLDLRIFLPEVLPYNIEDGLPAPFERDGDIASVVTAPSYPEDLHGDDAEIEVISASDLAEFPVGQCLHQGFPCVKG